MRQKVFLTSIHLGSNAKASFLLIFSIVCLLTMLFGSLTWVPQKKKKCNKPKTQKKQLTTNLFYLAFIFSILSKQLDKHLSK